MACALKTLNSLKGFSKAILKVRGGKGVAEYVIIRCTILWLMVRLQGR